MNQKLRSEISDEFKWDLTSIYADKKEFEKDILECTNLINKMKQCENILENADNLYCCIKLEYDTARILDKLYMYAHLSLDTDTTNVEAQEMVGKVKNLFKEYDEVTSFIKPTLLKCDYNLIEKYYIEKPELKEYEIVLKDLFRYKEHTLTENEEMIVSKLSKALTSSSDTYEKLTDSDMAFGIIKDEQNNDVELTSSNYSKYLKSKDRSVRKAAFDMTYETFSKYKNTIASTYIGDIEANASLAKIYKFSSALEASLFNDDVNTKVYDKLIETVSNNLEPLYRYYEIKRKKLSLEQLHLYDTYVSIVNESTKEYTFEEAKENVRKLLKQSFRPEFLNRLDEIVFYKPLQKTEIGRILDLLIKDLERRLDDKHISLNVTQSAKDYLINNGYDEVYGARPLKRFVQKKLETLIAKNILANKILPNTTITVDCKDDELFIK